MERAQRLLDNEDLHVLLSMRLQMLNADMLLSADDKAALEARKEYQAITYFAEWITQLGKPQRGGLDLEVKNRGN